MYYVVLWCRVQRAHHCSYNGGGGPVCRERGAEHTGAAAVAGPCGGAARAVGQAGRYSAGVHSGGAARGDRVRAIVDDQSHHKVVAVMQALMEQDSSLTTAMLDALSNLSL